MTNHFYSIPVWDTICVAWKKVSGAKASFWAAFGMTLLILFCVGFLEGVIDNISPGLKAVTAAVGNIIGFFLQMGVIYLGLQRANDQPITYRLMFRSFEANIALRLAGVYVIQFFIFLPLSLLLLPLFIMSGFIAGIAIHSIIMMIIAAILIPAACFLIFYVAIRLMFSFAFVLDEGINSWQAIKLSFKLTQSNFWRLTAIFLLQIGIILVSLIPLGIGLIWSLPFTLICYGMMYKNLQANLNS